MKYLFLACLIPTFAYCADYKLDVSHTNIGFKVKHLVVSTVNGRFNKFDGTFKYDEKKKVLSDIKVMIDANSIDTNDVDRDKHLRSEDFLDVEKNKTLEFVSTKITKKAGNKYIVVGDLTIRGSKKSVTLKAQLDGPVADPWKNMKLALTAETQIKRSDFGLIWNKKLETGGLLVDDKINIIIEGESQPQ
jgi:polyisoprenoid-binding protein YceI